jgi:colanic acid/amylovoran biosynthesis protein
LVRSIVAGLDIPGSWRTTVLTQTPDQDDSLLALPGVECVADPFVISRSLRTVAPGPEHELAAERERLVASADLLITTGGDLHTADYGVSSRYLAAPLAAQEHKVPVAMLAHSVGPFTDPDEAAVWSTAAQRCPVLTARETISWRYIVDDLGLPEDQVTLAADPAFLLQAAPAGQVDDILAGIGIQPGQPYVCLAPSKGIAAFRNLPEHEHTSALLSLVNCLVSRWRLPILLLPHVHDSRAHNDDRRLAADLADHVAHSAVRPVSGALTAAEYKAITARSVLTIAERMHAAIAALSSGVPTVAIGYSQKFLGILADTYGDTVPLDLVHIGVEPFVNDDKAGIRLVERIDLLALRAALAARLGLVRDRARSNFTRLADAIEALA